MNRSRVVYTRCASMALAAALAFTAPTARAEDAQRRVEVRGLLDLAWAGHRDGFDANLFVRGDTPFDAYAVRLFVEGQAAPGLQAFTQFVFNETSPVRADGAYLLWTPSPERDLHVMAGKIPWLIGTWAPRAYSDKNPLIGFPLLYQHHTSLTWYSVFEDADALLAAAGSGQRQAAWGEDLDRGQAVVDDGYWDVGAMLTGSARPLEFSAGFVNGTPGWGTVGREENDGKSVLGRIGWMPIAGVRVGVSGAYGPYVVDGTGPLPDGKDADDYHQRLMMADAEWLFGHVELRAEGFANTWETPWTGDLDVHGGYVEGKVTVLPGVYGAARWDRLEFSEVTDSGGAERAWEFPTRRFEAGLGYRASRALLLKGVFQRTRVDETTARRNRDLWGAQLSFEI